MEFLFVVYILGVVAAVAQTGPGKGRPPATNSPQEPSRASNASLKKMEVAGVPVWVKRDDGMDSDWIVMLASSAGNSHVKEFSSQAKGNGMHSKFDGHPGKGKGLSMSVVSGNYHKLTGTIRSSLARGLVIEGVEQDSKVMLARQANVSSWGLDRIDDRVGLDQSFDPGTASGAGVSVYIFDTGIRTTHSDFGGRAIPSLELVEFPGTICNPANTSCAMDRDGHGTHCAATVGGAMFGVAKNVTLRAVKILGDDGSGYISTIAAALDYVVATSQRPAVISMSLGAGISPLLDDAIRRAVVLNMTVIVAAGNENVNACLVSPARAPAAITVGATDRSDNRASYSNFGECVDLFAPGTDIKSAGIASDGDMTTKSGTSMATPHVAGAVALVLGKRPDLAPWDVQNFLVRMSTEDGLSEDVRSLGAASPNIFLYVNMTSINEWVPPSTFTHTSTIISTTSSGTSTSSSGTSTTSSGTGAATAVTSTALDGRSIDAATSGSLEAYVLTPVVVAFMSYHT